MAARHPLKALNISKIDIDAARAHFDLPIEDQFQSKADLRSGLKSTKGQLLDLLGDGPVFTVYRGMTVTENFIDTVEPDMPLGLCWAWDPDGALKGSGLASGNPAYGHLGVVLVATVRATDVNWPFTVAVNTFHEDEKEIVIEDGVGLLLQQVLLVVDGRVVRDILPRLKQNIAITSS